MADAEESPSSLADLEALAGLAEESSQSNDDFANDADAGDFDLAGLATSAGVGARDDGAVAGDDDRQDEQVVSPTPNPSAGVTTHVSGSVPANVPVSSSRGPWGFVLGVIAGVAAAGVLFLALRDTPEAVGLSPAVVVAPVVTNDSERPLLPSPSAAVATKAQPSATVSAPSEPPEVKVSRPVSARPATSAPAAVVAAAPVAQASAGDDSNDDPTRPPLTAPSAAPSTPSRPIDSLLDDALGSGKPTKRAKTDDLMGAELPLTPTAGDVTKVIQVLLPAIRGCAMGQSGVANTLLVVRSDGGVASVSVTGAPYAGAASGRCMEGVLRRAKFERFRQSVFRVQFPLSIRANAP